MTIDTKRGRALLEAATPGPWKVSDSHGLSVHAKRDWGSEMVADFTPFATETNWEGRREDAALICYLVNNAPALLEAADKLVLMEAFAKANPRGCHHCDAAEQRAREAEETVAALEKALCDGNEGLLEQEKRIAELEAVTAERDRLLDNPDFVDYLKVTCERDALRADNERLRKALEGIVDHCGTFFLFDEVPGATNPSAFVGGIATRARNALTPHKEE